MNRSLRAARITLVLLALGATGLSAQARLVLGVGGGVIFPTKGSFGDDVKSMGYHFQLMAGISPGAGKLAFRVDGQYGSVNYEEQTSGARPKDKILAVNGDLVFHPSRSGSIRPYLLAGPTWGHFSYSSGVTSVGDETTSNFGFNGGIGLNMGGGEKTWFFAEFRYIHTEDHKYMPLTVGIRINTRQAYAK